MGRAGAARLGSTRVSAPSAATVASLLDVWTERILCRGGGLAQDRQGHCLRRNGLAGSSLGLLHPAALLLGCHMMRCGLRVCGHRGCLGTRGEAGATGSGPAANVFARN